MNAHLYTPLFCEENIWQLAKSLQEQGIDVTTLQVIFITNRHRQVVMFNQREGADLGYVVWDYHVILRRHDATADFIYDFDTLLPFPCNTLDYMEASFGLQSELAGPYRSTLRLVQAEDYLRDFCSDRHHMQGMVPESAFPKWPPIDSATGNKTSLADYWDTTKRLDDGSRLMSVDAFVQQEL